MKKYIYISVAWVMLAVTGCSYLDMVPEKDIETIESIFEKKESVLVWLKTCYSFFNESTGSIRYNPQFLGADEMVAGDFTRREGSATSDKFSFCGFFIGDGIQMSYDPYGNIWNDNTVYAGIRYCNTFINNIDNVYNMLETEKRLWVAEVKALKAHFYFELMQHYGPIVLVPENIDLGNDVSVMLQPRSSIDDCVEAIVKLLDEAMVDLPPLNQKEFSRYAYHSQESAVALKAKALLLAASPLFNGNPAYRNIKNKNGEPLFSSTYDAEKWKKAAEAADEAVRVAELNGKALIAGSKLHNTPLLNTMLDIEKSVQATGFNNDEALFMTRYSNPLSDMYASRTLPYILDENSDHYHVSNRGCISPSMKMVEMYYTKNGVPIEEDKTWDYSQRFKMGKEISSDYKDVVGLETENVKEVLNLHLRREPRFYAHIAADRCYWQRGKERKHLMLIKPYRGEEIGTRSKVIDPSVPQNLSGYWLKKGTYSEVSAKDYLAVYQREEAVILIRLAELYMMQAEAWNEYEGPSEKVYSALDKVRKRAGLIGVKEAWTTYSKYPEKVTNKEGLREIVRREWNIEFAFEGHRFWNLRRWLTAQDELNQAQYGWNITSDNARGFYNNYEGPIVVWSKRKFLAPKDYLFPIKSEDILVSGNVQNPGW
ncbi:MAG: RagB/SusD family nutrient uptake outer membrane protein [Marinifilaceae bacterium]